MFPSCSDFSINLLQVVKENQILHKGQRVIDKECATLADMNIFPGDKLWVTDSEIHENRDIAGNYLLKLVQGKKKKKKNFFLHKKNRKFLKCWFFQVKFVG